MSNLSVALTYIRHQVVVFPCREAAGISGTAKVPYIEGGWHNASASSAQIRAWWKMWPNAVVGLPCRVNGIIVLDADRHGMEDGVAALGELFVQHEFETETVPCVSTPRNGRHYVFRRPSQLGDTKARIARAIDVRDNAYVISAGSAMADGRNYALAAGSVEQLAFAIAKKSLIELPEWLIAIVEKAENSNQIATGFKQSAADINAKPRLAGLIRAVVLAQPGQRNATLHWAACRAGELVKAGTIHRDAAAALLMEAGSQAGLRPREVRATICSGLASVKRA
jgi:hypothetical protein